MAENLLDFQVFVAFDARKVVQVLPDVAGSPLVETDFMVVGGEHEIVEIAGADARFMLFHRTLRHGLPGEGKAMRLERAMRAVGVRGEAVQGAEFHHGLVVEAGLRAIEQLVSQLGEEFLSLVIINRGVDVEEA